MKNYKILVLNKFYFPVAVEGVQKTFGNVFSGSVLPLDIEYEMEEDKVNLEVIEYFMPIKTAEEWIKLPIRPFDDYLQTMRGPVRVPSVVVCANYDKITYNKVQFPTKHNIYKRDNYQCIYTGEHLSKEDLSVDHILPRSRGGLDTWENLGCCKKILNSKKASSLPEECGLKLRYKPYKPTNGMSFDVYKTEWASFIKNFI